ncbi:transcriptional regulator NrdR [Patescibacteria group bacterium]|nr:transcriptional regulator NrdR [Patescibacteria group bacterium]
MKCPFCTKTDTQVLESRAVEDGNSIRRRRECVVCKKRFTTYEKTKGAVLWVIKKGGRREPFEKEKVKRGILRAIEKRPVSLDLVNDIVDAIEREMLRREKEEISSKVIGRAILKRLKRIDKVAWLRFASVYMEFEDLKDFKKTVEKG